MTSFVTCAGCGAPTGGAYRCVRCLQSPAGRVAVAVALPAPASAVAGGHRPRRSWVAIGVIAVLAVAALALQPLVGRRTSGTVTVSARQAADDVRTFYAEHHRTASTITCSRQASVKGIAAELCRATVAGVTEDVTVSPIDRAGHDKLTLTGMG